MDFIVKISVDEDELRSVTGDYETSIEGLVKDELRGVERSGIISGLSFYELERYIDFDAIEKQLDW